MSQVATMANRTTQEFETPRYLVTYRIYLDPAEEGGFIVTSPDLNGLVTQGETEEDAIKNAYQATELLLEDESTNKEFILLSVDR